MGGEAGGGRGDRKFHPFDYPIAILLKKINHQSHIAANGLSMKLAMLKCIKPSDFIGLFKSTGQWRI
jgi:hypothetical protein